MLSFQRVILNKSTKKLISKITYNNPMLSLRKLKINEQYAIVKDFLLKN